MNNKRTLIIGASENPIRYSNLAIQTLRKHQHEVVALSKRSGSVSGVTFQTEFPSQENIHTVTLYIGPKHQQEYYQSLINLKPERVIFNPGTENYELEILLEKNGIETIQACTLVMLNTGQY